MQLHKHKEEFETIVEAVAEEYGLRNFQVEKDYYVSLFLKELSKLDSTIEVVFKGGTSLSKCYDVIDRFSEDIDLAVNFNNNKVTPGQRKRLKKDILDIVEKLEMELLNPDDVQSRRDHNKYNVGFSNNYQVELSTVPYIIIETIVVYRPFPIKKMEVSNYITKYLSKNNRTDLIKQYNLEPFTMPIQTIERTFVDKLFAICDYHLQKNYYRYSRHIYDLHKMWTSKLINQALMKNIIDDVIKDRQIFGRQNTSCEPGMNPQLVLSDILENDPFKDDYESVTTAFIHKKVSYAECIDSIKEIHKNDILPSFIKNYRD
jgi:predicted nucleotidyltransferase component of viral defense system